MNEKAKKALDSLIEGNKNFVNGISTAKNRTVEITLTIVPSFK